MAPSQTQPPGQPPSGRAPQRPIDVASYRRDGVPLPRRAIALAVDTRQRSRHRCDRRRGRTHLSHGPMASCPRRASPTTCRRRHRRRGHAHGQASTRGGAHPRAHHGSLPRYPRPRCVTTHRAARESHRHGCAPARRARLERQAVAPIGGGGAPALSVRGEVSPDSCVLRRQRARVRSFPVSRSGPLPSVPCQSWRGPGRVPRSMPRARAATRSAALAPIAAAAPCGVRAATQRGRLRPPEPHASEDAAPCGRWSLALQVQDPPLGAVSDRQRLHVARAQQAGRALQRPRLQRRGRGRQRQRSRVHQGG